MKRVGVVLCGAGRFDGSEIQESVLTLLHLVRGGARPVCLAPDAGQWAVCEHFGGEVLAGEQRNQLQEAARIARGEVAPLESVDPSGLDALILPGGTGAARNLCDFADKGEHGRVLPALAGLIRAMHTAGKPIGAICIAPAIVALVLGAEGVTLTLGREDRGSSRKAARTGARMVSCAVDGIVVDDAHNLVSTPAYILAENIAEADAGIGRLVAEVLRRTAVAVG